MDILRLVLFLLLLCWFSGLGFSTLFGAVFGGRNGGPNGARWWVRTTGRHGRRLTGRTSEGVGRSFVGIVSFLHNFFYTRFPQQTMVFLRSNSFVVYSGTVLR